MVQFVQLRGGSVRGAPYFMGPLIRQFVAYRWLVFVTQPIIVWDWWGLRWWPSPMDAFEAFGAPPADTAIN